jgi:subtilisin family serine protease
MQKADSPTTANRTAFRIRALFGSVVIALAALLVLITTAHHASATSALQAPVTDQQPLHEGEEEIEIYGQLALSVTSFVGEWVVAVDAQEPLTIVLDSYTDVRKFRGILPDPGLWLKAEGRYLADGRFKAKKVRPDSSVANQVIVRLKPTPEPDVVVQALATEYGLFVESVLRSADIYLFTTSEDEEDDVNRLLTDDRIEWVELNRVSRVPTGSPYRTWKWGDAEDSDYYNQRAFEQVNLPPAAGAATGAGVTVAILDTGVDLQHPTFDGLLVILPTSDMISDTNAPDDIGPGLAWGHGTHIAGVVHAIAPAAQLMPIRVLDSQGRGNTFVLAYAIEQAIAQGADIINLSLGADCESRILKEVIASAAAQDIVIAAAAGNDASIVPTCPASLPGVISVAAVEETRQRAGWSNYGEWIMLAAPGVGITSTFPLGYGVEITATPGYASWSGTSMATPFVSGAAALLLERQADFLQEMSVATRLAVYGDNIGQLNPRPFSVGRHLNVGDALLSDLPEEPEPPDETAFTLFLPSVTR